MKLGINGRFYGAPVTGVQRYAIEVTKRIVEQTNATLLLPANARTDELPAGANILRGRLSAHAWEQIELPAMSRAAGCNTVLHLAGTAPFHCENDTVVIHDVLPLTHPQWFGRSFRIWRQTVLQRVARKAAQIVTVSDWARHEISGQLNVPLDRITVTTQGLAPFDEPAHPDVIANVRNTLGLSEPFVLAVGAGDPRKNMSFLGLVADRWKREFGLGLNVVAVGAPNARWFARAADQSGAVHLLGHVDDTTMHALYTSAAALCFPSFAEGFGRPPLEAMACGTPAVVADYGAAKEAVGDFARIVPLDVDAWVQAIRETISERVPEDVRSSLRARYDWDTAAGQVLEACAACA